MTRHKPRGYMKNLRSLCSRSSDADDIVDKLVSRFAAYHELPDRPRLLRMDQASVSTVKSCLSQFLSPRLPIKWLPLPYHFVWEVSGLNVASHEFCASPLWSQLWLTCWPKSSTWSGGIDLRPAWKITKTRFAEVVNKVADFSKL